MKSIFINLKRFDVPLKMGGLCRLDDPREWIRRIMEKSMEYGLGKTEGIQIIYLLPESLIIPAADSLKNLNDPGDIFFGAQSVHFEDVCPGINFGAFTSSRPASAVRNMGCTWTMAGHSEERRAKSAVISEYTGSSDIAGVSSAVSRLINMEVKAAVKAGLKVLLCVGESEDEKGHGSQREQQASVKTILDKQLNECLAGTEAWGKNIVIGYEPLWAIGPGKTPPGADYISFVSEFIKETTRNLSGYVPDVVYGGGLKEENAPVIASVPAIDGGLVALTRFTGEIGFYTEELKRIIEAYNRR